MPRLDIYSLSFNLYTEFLSKWLLEEVIKHLHVVWIQYVNLSVKGVLTSDRKNPATNFECTSPSANCAGEEIARNRLIHYATLSIKFQFVYSADSFGLAVRYQSSASYASYLWLIAKQTELAGLS